MHFISVKIEYRHPHAELPTFGRGVGVLSLCLMSFNTKHQNIAAAYSLSLHCCRDLSAQAVASVITSPGAQMPRLC